MRLKKPTGQALVEFALVVPLLIILIFGIIEFGVLLYDKAVITNASREGARYGIVLRQTRYTKAEIEAVAQSYCQNHLVTFVGTSVPVANATFTTQNFGDPLSVQVSYNYAFLVLPKFLGLGQTLNLQATTVMKYE